MTAHGFRKYFFAFKMCLFHFIGIQHEAEYDVRIVVAANMKNIIIRCIASTAARAIGAIVISFLSAFFGTRSL